MDNNVQHKNITLKNFMVITKSKLCSPADTISIFTFYFPCHILLTNQDQIVSLYKPSDKSWKACQSFESYQLLWYSHIGTLRIAAFKIRTQVFKGATAGLDFFILSKLYLFGLLNKPSKYFAFLAKHTSFIRVLLNAAYGYCWALLTSKLCYKILNRLPNYSSLFSIINS